MNVNKIMAELAQYTRLQEEAAAMVDSLKDQIKQYLTDDLDPLGRQIIECCLNDGTLDDYLRLTPM